MLRIFGLRFLLGNQHAVAMGEFQLHVGDAGARRCARCVLNWEFGDAGKFPETGEIALLRYEGILFVYMDEPEQAGGARLKENPSVTRITASARLVNGSGLLAIQG